MSDKLREALDRIESDIDAALMEYAELGTITGWDATLGKIAATFAIARAALRDADGWVSVKERLPECIGHHLIYYLDYNGDHRIAWAFFTSDSRWAHTEGFYDNGSERVTHWRPLPEPPKEEI